MKKNLEIFIAFLFIAAAFAAGIYYYPQMPDLMASHWDIDGHVDGYSPKAIALFFMPVFFLAILGLFILVPKIDPLRRNYAEFKKNYDTFILFLIGFLSYVYALTLVWNSGVFFDMGRMIAPAFGIFFYYIGVLLTRAKQNWFIGIRTPWTLSSQEVWNKTNRRGGIIFKIYGVALLSAVFAGGNFLFWLMMSLIPAMLYLVAYSFLEFRKIEK